MPTPIQQLNQLEVDYSAQRYPDIREELRPSRRHKVTGANSLTKAVIRFIVLNGGQAERISVTGRAVDQRQTFTDVLGHQRVVGSVKWIKSSMTKGTADISATIRGKSVKIEIKWGADRQSEVQREYQRSIEQAGGIYLVVRTFDDFYNWYTSWQS